MARITVQARYAQGAAIPRYLLDKDTFEMFILILCFDKADCILFIFLFIINFNKFALFFLLFFHFELEVSIIYFILIYAWVIAAIAILTSDRVAFAK